MPRIRTIKPDFFFDEELDQLSEVHQKLFIGLWTLADREGKLEDQPKKIRAQIFPYRPHYDVDELLADLDQADFVHRYDGPDGSPYILIPKFVEHQRPHPKEQANGFPDPKSREKKRRAVKRPVETRVVSPQLSHGEGDLGSGKEIFDPPPSEPEPVAESAATGPQDEEDGGFNLSNWIQAWLWIEAMRRRKGLPPEARQPKGWKAFHERAVTEFGVEGLNRAYRRFLDDDPPEFRPQGWPATAVFITPGVFDQRATAPPRRAFL